jgi:hypothetical protein
MTGGSKDPKDWTFSANKESYLSVKDKLKPTKKQPGKFDGAYDMGMGKGHHIDEGTCGYGEDGVLGEEPAGPHLQKEESEGDKEIRALEKKAEKYPKGDSRREVIQKKIGDLKSDKEYALPGSKADKKFSDMEDELERLLNKGVGYKSSIYSNFMEENMNDPVLVKARAAKMAAEKEKAKQDDLDKKYGKNFMDKLEAEIILKQQLGDLKSEREQIMIDMEQEAEPEGGKIADEYGSRLNDIDSRMELIQKDIDDLRMYESVNESYMGNKGDEVMITNTKKPDGDIPGNWVLEKPDGSAMVDMFFNSKEAAKKYAKGKELKLVPGFKEDINEDFTHSSLAITDQSQISGLDDLELLDLLNRVSYEYTPELKNAARIIAQEIEDRNLTSKIHYVDNKRYEFKESVGVEEEIETSLTPNEIGDESVERESNSAAYESLQESLRKKLKARLK